MIVVDVNIIAYRFIQGDNTDRVLIVHQKDHDWILPSLWRHEFLNVLSTIARHEILEPNQCIEVWENAVRVLRSSERSVDMIQALSLSIENSVSAYDAQYITLAKSLKVKCLTTDKRLLKTFPEIAVSLEKF